MFSAHTAVSGNWLDFAGRIQVAQCEFKWESSLIWTCFFSPAEEHAVLEGILPGRPGSPQSCTGAGLPLDGDGSLTLPSHGQGAPGCGEQLTGGSEHSPQSGSGVSVVYDPGLWHWAPGPTASHLDQRGSGGNLAARLQFMDQRKDSKLLMIPEKYALKKKNKVHCLFFLFVFK